MSVTQQVSPLSLSRNQAVIRVGVRAVCDGCGGEQTTIIGTQLPEGIDGDLDAAIQSGHFAEIAGTCRQCGESVLHGRRAWFADGWRH